MTDEFAPPPSCPQLPESATPQTPLAAAPQSTLDAPVTLPSSFGLARALFAASRDVASRAVIIQVTDVAIAASRPMIAAARPAVGVAMRPPLVPRGLWPETILAAALARERVVRAQVDRRATKALNDVIKAILARIDLTAVIEAIDIEAIIDKVDIPSVVGRVDVAGIAHQVIEDVDLPRIIRESSGAVASESVVGVRHQSFKADEQINRIIDRVLLRRQSIPPASD